MIEPIVKTLTVPCSATRAFDVFVTQTSRWWPLDKNSVSAGGGQPARAVTIEPRVGGSVYETMHDGTRSDWGRVLEFEPGMKLAMTWHPGGGPEISTRVEVVFETLGSDRARVTLTHSGWDAWADKGAELRTGYNGGWVYVIETCFAGACTPHPTA